MNPNLFEKRDDLNKQYNTDDLNGKLDLVHYASEQEKGRQKMWQWRREIWKDICDVGLGHVFVIDLPRRYGKSRIAHHIASNGFKKGIKITTIHPGQRSIECFKNIGLSEFDSTILSKIDSTELSKVFIYDDGNYIIEDVNQMKNICNTLRKQDCTVFIIGTDIKDCYSDFADYVASYTIQKEDLIGNCLK